MKYKKIYLEITNYCNKKCNFCSKDNRLLNEMSLAKIKTILPDIKKYTNYLYLHVKGEPLLHSEFSQIISYLDQENIWINITTNGTLIHNYVDELGHNEHVRQINISVHSFNDDQYIEKILEAIDRILDINSNVNIVLRFWALSNNSFNQINRDNIDKIIKHYALNKEVVDQIFNKKNIKIKERLYINKDDLFKWPNLNDKKYPDSFCLGLKSHIAILSNGTVVPCCLDSEGIINLGNIFEESLDIILSKQKTKIIIDTFRNNKCSEELCKHCSFRLK